MLLVLSQGLTRGTSASVSANLGILAGNACYFTLSATGLGAILMASYDLFSLIRWIGAGYLVWLGVMAFKALVFFTALLPPFIDPRGSVVAQVAVLGVTSVVIEFFVLLAYGALAGRLTSVATRPRFQIVANRVAGGMLVAAGVSVALQGSRRPT